MVASKIKSQISPQVGFYLQVKINKHEKEHKNDKCQRMIILGRGCVLYQFSY